MGEEGVLRFYSYEQRRQGERRGGTGAGDDILVAAAQRAHTSPPPTPAQFHPHVTRLGERGIGRETTAHAVCHHCSLARARVRERGTDTGRCYTRARESETTQRRPKRASNSVCVRACVCRCQMKRQKRYKAPATATATLAPPHLSASFSASLPLEDSLPPFPSSRWRFEAGSPPRAFFTFFTAFLVSFSICFAFSSISATVE